MKKQNFLFFILLLCGGNIEILAQSPGGVATDLSVWYKADAGVTTNGTKQVTQWSSSSSTNVALTPSGAAILPYNDQTTYTKTLNFNPTVTFDGTNNYLRNTTTAYLTAAGSVHYIVAARGTNRSTATRNLFSLGGNDDGFFYSGVGGDTAFPTIGNNYNVTAASITSVEDLGIYSAILPKTVAQGTQRGFYNGLKKNYPSPYPYTGALYSLPTTGAYIGADGTTGDNFLGDIAEVILYHNTTGGDLSDGNLEKIHSYLAIKYGMTLTSTQNYLTSASQIVWNATTNAGYTSNIFGIGRDNTSGLHQKQSTSTNVATTQKLIIGNGTTLFNTNALNTNDITDGQFLLVGDNGLKQAPIVALSNPAAPGGATNYRFESIWKVQNTNATTVKNVGVVTVAWPAGFKNFHLIRSSDAIIDASDTFVPMNGTATINGVVYNTATVTLTDGEYFTFADYEFAPGGVTAAAWYRADGSANLFSDAGTTVAANNATIQQWNEFNNKPFPLSQATANLRPEFSNATTLVNFNPTVNYTTSGKWLQYDGNTLGNIIDRSTGALFSAGNTTGTTAFFGFGTSGAGNTMDDPGLYNFTGNKFLFYPIIGEYDPQSTYTINGSYIGGGTWQNAAGVGGNNAVDITLNGYHQTYNTGISNVTMVAGRNALMAGGAETSVAFQQNEMIVFPNKLTDQETNRIESYLAIKYGQTLSKEQSRNYLSSTATVVWEGSANNSYYNNVFGIARENISALYQKQSKSVNANQKLIVGIGNTLADTNAANTNSLAEGQFLITGDNGLKQSLATPLSYTAGSNGVTNYRFESIWKTQNTGSVGTVTVAWPKGVKNLYLIQSSDAVFDGTDTFTPMTTEITVSGVVYNTANVTLGNGQFFTFAGFGNTPGGVADGLSYWYRADKNAANTGVGTDVTGWTDVWNGTTVAQLGTNALPKYVLGTSNYFNFNPGINFTANTQTLGNNTVRTLTSLNFDIFTLTKEGVASGGAAYPRIFSVARDNITTGALNWDGFGIWTSAILERRVYGTDTSPGASIQQSINPVFSTTIPSIMYFQNTDTSSVKGLNGAATGTAGSYTAIGYQYGGYAFGSPQFSSNGSDNIGFIGNIGETIVYGAGTLTTTNRRKVDSYLAIKYGITLGRVDTDHYLDTDGNMVWNGASNTTYNNNIFGVTRDDIEILEQKVSKSVNTGTILTVATINDFINPNQNVARTGFANDKTYFLLGDNNVTATPLVNVTVAGSTLKRIQRAWLSQRKNTPNALYFEVDLSAYGTTFATGSAIQMLVADDAAFTTNVKQVAGTYANGKWVFSNDFNADNAQRYITFAGLFGGYCTTGCNENTYLNATDPNTIEYDNLVAGDLVILAKEKDGVFKIWGWGTASDGGANSNLLVPTAITPANGFNYTGTPLKATLASGMSSSNCVLLTTDGLYTWGSPGLLVPYGIKSTNPFSKISVGGKADGLPPGVLPADVKMMFGTQSALVIVTCNGEAWTLVGASYTGSSISSNYGDGSAGTAANDIIWHRVKTSATQTLDNVVAVRGNAGAKFALTSGGKLYTWGLNTYIGDGSDNVANGTLQRPFATEVIVPNGVTPKMIGMSQFSGYAYYLLATDGRLFAMGNNSQRQLGDGTTTSSNVWKEVTATSGGHTLGGNIVWISSNEHDGSVPSINVLTNDKKQWGWGVNLRYKLGQASEIAYDPIYMPGNSTNANGLSLTDEVTAVESGGYFSMNFKKGSSYFGFVGLGEYGTLGNGSTGSGLYRQKYSYDTAIINICAAFLDACYKPGIITGTALDTKVGITALSRAGTGNSDNWPMVRKGGWLALESKTKAFVPNRLSFDTSGNPVGIASANFVEGMMVYDTTNKCMKIYSLKEGEASMAWHCISTQTCPD